MKNRRLTIIMLISALLTIVFFACGWFMSRHLNKSENEPVVQVTVTPAPTEQPTNTPTATPTVTPIARVTNTPTVNPTTEVTPTYTPSPVPTETPTPTHTPTPTFTPVPTSTPTLTPTNTPSPKPTKTPIPTNTPTPTKAPKPTQQVKVYWTPTPTPIPEKISPYIPYEGAKQDGFASATYDTNGNMTETVYYDKNKNVDRKIAAEYDNENRVTQSDVMDKNGTVRQRTVYEYTDNSDGSYLVSIHTEANGEVYPVTGIMYYDAKGNLTKKEKLAYTQDYNTKEYESWLKSRVVYNENGSVYSWTVWNKDYNPHTYTTRYYEPIYAENEINDDTPYIREVSGE